MEKSCPAAPPAAASGLVMSSHSPGFQTYQKKNPLITFQFMNKKIAHTGDTNSLDQCG